MAKSGDKVKKGFIFYVFMLLLLLLAAFLIIVMIMLFSPRTVILGYQYFNYSNDYNFVKTTGDEPQDLNFSEITKINVNAGYANVSIIKSSDDKSVDTIHVINNAKGFAHSDDYVDFECSVLVEDNILNIILKEPDSFLYFSKDISIEIIVSKDNIDNLNNAEVSINTKSGDVVIGSSDKNSAALDISDLSVTTDTGDISLMENDGEDEEIVFNSLLLSTKSGEIRVADEKTIISIIKQAKFSISDNGSVKFNEIQSTFDVNINVNNGSFEAKKINGRVIVSKIKDGSIKIDEICAPLENKSSFVVEDEQTGKANIKIGTVNYVSIPMGNQANIEIDTINKGSIIRTTSGNISIKEHAGTDFYFETVSGDIDVVLKDENLSNGYIRTLQSKSGNINVKFLNYVKNLNNIYTNGNIEIVLPQNSKFLLDAYNSNGQLIDSLGNNLTIAFVKSEDYHGHFKVNYRDGDDEQIYLDNVVSIYSDGKINMHLA